MPDQASGTPMHVPDARDREIAQRYFARFVKYFADAQDALEVACGQGFFLEQVRAAGGAIRGIEMDHALCDALRARGLDVIEGDFFTYLEQSEAGLHDAFMASHIVEHFDTADVRRLFEGAWRVTRPGAHIVVLTPNIANIRRAVGDFWRDPTHVRPYPISALSNLLRMSGWRIVDSGEHSDRKPSVLRSIKYAIRNALFGRYWVGDDVYVVAEKAQSPT